MPISVLKSVLAGPDGRPCAEHAAAIRSIGTPGTPDPSQVPFAPHAATRRSVNCSCYRRDRSVAQRREQRMRERALAHEARSGAGEVASVLRDDLA